MNYFLFFFCLQFAYSFILSYSNEQLTRMPSFQYAGSSPRNKKVEKKKSDPCPSNTAGMYYDFRHKFGKRSQNVTKGIAGKISLQFDEYFSNFLHSNFYWYIRDFHYNLLSKAQSYHKNIIFFSDMATSSMANASSSTDGNVESSSTQQQSET